MSKLLVISRRLALAVAALGLAAGWTANARAEQAYAFASETVSGLAATNAAGTAPDTNVVLGSPIIVGSNTSATLDAAGEVHGNAADALQSYVGTLPRAPENFFTKYATFGVASPVPAGTFPTGVQTVPPTVGPLREFSRGDELVTLATNTGSAVAESLLNHLGGSASGQGNNQINVPFTVTTTATSNIHFSFANDAYAVAVGPGDTAQASYKFNITITDQTLGGTQVYNNSPAVANLSLAAPPNGEEVIRTGAITLTDLPTFVAGHNYNLTFTLAASTNVTTGVPEPATMAMALTALPLVGFGLLRRRNRKARA